MRFPMPPSLDGIPIPDKLRQVLQRWMSDLRLWAAGLSSGGTIATQDEGISVDTAAATLNFVGAGVTATDGGGHVTTVTIPGGSGVTSPLTTKGDVWGFSTLDARIPVGADTTVLTADSAQALGVKWAVAGSGAPVDAQYLTLALNATLTQERRFVQTGAGATFTDGGANADATLYVGGAGQSGGQFNWGLYLAGKGCPF